MKRKIDIDKFDFEAYTSNALKAYGFLFPDNDDQMSIYEQSMGTNSLPAELENPLFVLGSRKPSCAPKIKIDLLRNDENEGAWAIAAREGKDIPNNIWEQMKRDKEAAKKKQ